MLWRQQQNTWFLHSTAHARTSPFDIVKRPNLFNGLTDVCKRLQCLVKCVHLMFDLVVNNGLYSFIVVRYGKQTIHFRISLSTFLFLYRKWVTISPFSVLYKFAFLLFCLTRLSIVSLIKILSIVVCYAFQACNDNANKQCRLLLFF